MNFLKIKVYDINKKAIIERKLDVKKILKLIFPEYEPFESNYKYSVESGYPDYILKHKIDSDKDVFIEWKSEDDSLRQNQLNWIIKNKKGLIVWLNGSGFIGKTIFECRICSVIKEVSQTGNGKLDFPEKCNCNSNNFKILNNMAQKEVENENI